MYHYIRLANERFESGGYPAIQLKMLLAKPGACKEHILAETVIADEQTVIRQGFCPQLPDPRQQVIQLGWQQGIATTAVSTLMGKIDPKTLPDVGLGVALDGSTPYCGDGICGPVEKKGGFCPQDCEDAGM